MLQIYFTPLLVCTHMFLQPGSRPVHHLHQCPAHDLAVVVGSLFAICQIVLSTLSLSESFRGDPSPFVRLILCFLTTAAFCVFSFLLIPPRPPHSVSRFCSPLKYVIISFTVLVFFLKVTIGYVCDFPPHPFSPCFRCHHELTRSFL